MSSAFRAEIGSPGRDVLVFWTASGIVALHAIVDSFVATEPGTGPSDHLLRGIVSLGLLGAAAVAYPRLRAGGPYDLIFANILAGPLRRLAGELAEHHAPGGVAILSGILERQAAGVVAVYRGWGYRPADAVRIDGWTTLVLARR